jgi:hypothetical protein
MRPEVVKDAIKALREQQRGGDGLARYLKRKGQKIKCAPDDLSGCGGDGRSLLRL